MEETPNTPGSGPASSSIPIAPPVTFTLDTTTVDSIEKMQVVLRALNLTMSQEQFERAEPELQELFKQNAE